MTTAKLQRFTGFRANRPCVRVSKLQQRSSMAVGSRRALTTTAGYIGSQTNLIVCGCTALCLIAGRLGLAPTSNKQASAGLNLTEVPLGLKTGDPSGFNVVDVMALGSFGHIIAAGIILGLQATS